jgi:hypothetical protein
MAPRTAKPNLSPGCGSCHFWYRFESGIGECRRHSPRTLTTIEIEQKVIANKGVWPRTFEHEWCGDYAKQDAGRGG